MLTACSELLPPGASVTEVPETVTPAVPTRAPGKTSTPALTPTPAGPVTLHIWVPPQFDPESGTPAGDIFKQRLEEFSQRRPGVRVEVRVKAVGGPGGLLDSLTTASAAAPLALPDLIALPHSLLETAALKGLLHPYNGLTTTMEDPDWYEYTRQLAMLQNSIFGLPFAGDALIMVYRPGVIATPPTDWQSLLESTSPLIFAANDPQATFTLAQYQAAGGVVRDEQGRPFLDAAILSQVLAFYGQGAESGMLPFWLTQYASDDEVWQAYLDSQSDLAVTWASRYLSNMPVDTAAAPILAPGEEPFTLATGWVWALASPQAEHQEQSAQLAEFLIESSFLARWTEASGYLPPRPSSLRAWDNPSMQSLIEQVVVTADLIPFSDVLTSLGPPLQSATVGVLKEQSDPNEAADAAVAGLSTP